MYWVNPLKPSGNYLYTGQDQTVHSISVRNKRWGGGKGWVRVAGKETYCQNYKHNFPVAVLYNLLSQVMILVVRGLVPTTVPPALTIRTSAFYPQIIFMGFD
jgi:hypothetical protein